MEGAEKRDVIKCEDNQGPSYEETIPVLGNDRYIYRNPYCAKCNFVDNYETLNLSASCYWISSMPDFSFCKYKIIDDLSNPVTKECNAGKIGLKSCGKDYHYAMRTQEASENIQITIAFCAMKPD